MQTNHDRNYLCCTKIRNPHFIPLIIWKKYSAQVHTNNIHVRYIYNLATESLILLLVLSKTSVLKCVIQRHSPICIWCNTEALQLIFSYICTQISIHFPAQTIEEKLTPYRQLIHQYLHQQKSSVISTLASLSGIQIFLRTRKFTPKRTTAAPNSNIARQIHDTLTNQNFEILILFR